MVVGSFKLPTEGWVSNFIELLRYFHGQCREPHWEHKKNLNWGSWLKQPKNACDYLRQVKEDKGTPSLSESMKGAEPEEQECKEEEGLEDGVKDATDEGGGGEGEGEEGVVVEDEKQKEYRAPSLFH